MLVKVGDFTVAFNLGLHSFGNNWSLCSGSADLFILGHNPIETSDEKTELIPALKSFEMGIVLLIGVPVPATLWYFALSNVELCVFFCTVNPANCLH